jgi:hypothetical protein
MKISTTKLLTYMNNRNSDGSMNFEVEKVRALEKAGAKIPDNVMVHFAVQDKNPNVRRYINEFFNEEQKARFRIEENRLSIMLGYGPVPFYLSVCK